MNIKLESTVQSLKQRKIYLLALTSFLTSILFYFKYDPIRYRKATGEELLIPVIIAKCVIRV